MENDLVSQFNERNQQAFKALFNKLYPVLFRIAFKRVKDHQDAEDMVMISFRKMWFWDKKFIDYDELKGHLIGILENTCIDYLRKKKFIYEKLEAIEELEMKEKERVDQDMIKKLHHNVSKLTPELNNVIRLELEGCSQKEISIIKSKNIDTVYRNRWMAIKKLKSLFNIK